MKNSDVKKLTVYEFVRLLTNDNFDYIKEVYSSFEWALEHYKEELEESGKDNVDINDFFELDRINRDNYSEY